jgi:hypothetical protein
MDPGVSLAFGDLVASSKRPTAERARMNWETGRFFSASGSEGSVARQQRLSMRT